MIKLILTTHKILVVNKWLAKLIFNVLLKINKRLCDTFFFFFDDDLINKSLGN